MIKFSVVCFVMALSLNFAFADEVKIEGTTIIKLHSEKLNDDLLIKVQLPLGFDPTKKYPVLYMTDANLYFETVSGVMRTIDYAAMMGMPTVPHVLVGIGYDTADPFQILYKRSRDLTPTVVNPAPAPWDAECGHADVFISSLEQEIFPLIENTFSVDSKQRNYFGHSYGGLFGAYVMLSRPELFQGLILSSPSLWWDSEYISRLEANFSKSNTELSSKVYLGVGAGEEKELMIEPLENLKNSMVSHNYKKLELQAQIHQSMGHVTVFGSNFAMGLKFLNDYPDSL